MSTKSKPAGYLNILKFALFSSSIEFFYFLIKSRIEHMLLKGIQNDWIKKNKAPSYARHSLIL